MFRLECVCEERFVGLFNVYTLVCKVTCSNLINCQSVCEMTCTGKFNVHTLGYMGVSE